MHNLKRFFPLVVALHLMFAALGEAQISTSAYRGLGQPDLRQNGVNLVQGVELLSPLGLALDVAQNGEVHLYISDTLNNRVLAWRDTRSYAIGEPPAMILGQPGPQYSGPQGIGEKGFSAPLGLSVDPNTGNLYVADFGNNRIVRFPAPFDNPSRVEPDMVYGQPDFSTNTAGTTSSRLRAPRSVTFDASGNLWVADSGNHRVLRFSAAVLESPIPPDADTVVGQSDFSSGLTNNGAGAAVSATGFNLPSGLSFDSQGNLYVADFNNNRVLKFAPPLGPAVIAPAATAVVGQPDFETATVPPQASNSTLAGPVGVFADATNLYVAVPADNRALAFSLSRLSSGAHGVFGQADFTTTQPNANVFPRASAGSLSGPRDIVADPSGGVFVADSDNNRVLGYPANSKSAINVWGQNDFASNGPNKVQPAGTNGPNSVAVDYSDSPNALYISDSGNHRILVWKDAIRFRTGDPADLVIGQPDLHSGIANVDTGPSQKPSSTSLFAPAGIAVQPDTGDLLVADSRNNRVLRFPRPVDQAGRITADVVVGQVDFSSSVSALVTASSLRAPGGVAFGPDGNLFVADTGNNRILEFASLNQPAIRVYGQPNFNSSVSAPQVSAQTLTEPLGMFVDSAFNLYAADTGSNRVLIFPDTQAAPLAGMAAAFVIGQPSFNTTGGGLGTSLRSPSSVRVSRTGRIYVADSANNRVLEFPPYVFLPVAGAVATAVVGQPNLFGGTANWNSPDGLTTPEGLSRPTGIYLDRQDTLYVADAGNSRVVHFLKPAAMVNAATYQAGVPVAGGGLVALFGSGIVADGEVAAAGEVPLPTSLLNRQVVINDDVVSPLFYVSSTQINCQLPALTPPGSGRFAIRASDTGELIAGGAVSVAANSPGLFTLSQDGRGQAAAVNYQNGAMNGASNPADRGSVVLLFGTGQGQVSPLVQDGVAASANPLSRTVSVPTSDGTTCVTSQLSMCVALGTSFGEIQYSGLAPGFVGLWQINVKIPADVTPGDAVPVRAVINGAPSNIATLAIR